jgi:hypothetical protein
MKRISLDAQHHELQADSTGGPIGPSVAELRMDHYLLGSGRGGCRSLSRQGGEDKGGREVSFLSKSISNASKVCNIGGEE